MRGGVKTCSWEKENSGSHVTPHRVFLPSLLLMVTRLSDKLCHKSLGGTLS